MIAQKLTKNIEFIFQKKYDQKIETRDGIKLSTIVAIPDINKEFETMIIRTPYSAKGMVRLLSIGLKINRPMVWIIQDCRGRYDSEGEFDLFNEENDTVDTLNWIVNQPWSNGDVHFFGPSYLGWVALQVLQSKTDANIKSIFSPMTFSSAVNEAIYTKSGVMNLHHSFPFSLMMSTRVQANLGSINGEWPDVYYSSFPEGPKAVGWPNKIWDLFRDKNKLRDLTISYHKDSNFSTKATLIGSYNDFLCNAAINVYNKIKNIGGVIPSLKIGPWGHNGYLTSLDHIGAFSITDEGKGNIVQDLKRHFGTVDNPEKHDISVFVLRKNVWKNFDSWPLPITNTCLFLHEEGILSNEATNNSRMFSIQADISNPVSTLGGPVWEGPTKNLLPGPIDQREINNREDIIKFVSSPLEHEIIIMGNISLSISASANIKNSHLTAKLNVVTENNEELIIQEGVALIKNGEFNQYEVDMGFTSLEIKKGEKLMIEISWSNFPRYELANHLQNHSIRFQINSLSSLNFHTL